MHGVELHKYAITPSNSPGYVSSHQVERSPIRYPWREDLG